MPLHRRWLYALKPASWAKLAVPALLGCALGTGGQGLVGLSIISCVWAGIYTFGLLVFVVLLNDWGDRKVDALKRSLFPNGCSPKTIPDGLLPANHLLAVGCLAGLWTLAAGVCGEIVLERPGLGVAVVCSLGLFVAYTLPPVRLNYLGGGELLEMVGVGVVLPAVLAYAVGGAAAFEQGGWLVVVAGGWALLALASAIASGLADEVSDRRGGKHTFATALGSRGARRVLELCVFGAGAWWSLATVVVGGVNLRTLALLVVTGLTVATGFRLLIAGGSVATSAFAEIGRYKRRLHDGIRAVGSVLTLVSLLPV